MAAEANDIILALGEQTGAADTPSTDQSNGQSSNPRGQGASENTTTLSNGSPVGGATNKEVPSPSSLTYSSNSSSGDASTSGNADSASGQSEADHQKSGKKSVTFESQFSSESIRSRTRDEPLDEEVGKIIAIFYFSIKKTKVYLVPLGAGLFVAIFAVFFFCLIIHRLTSANVNTYSGRNSVGLYFKRKFVIGYFLLLIW